MPTKNHEAENQSDAGEFVNDDLDTLSDFFERQANDDPFIGIPFTEIAKTRHRLYKDKPPFKVRPKRLPAASMFNKRVGKPHKASRARRVRRWGPTSQFHTVIRRLRLFLPARKIHEALQRIHDAGQTLAEEVRDYKQQLEDAGIAENGQLTVCPIPACNNILMKGELWVDCPRCRRDKLEYDAAIARTRGAAPAPAAPPKAPRKRKAEGQSPAPKLTTRTAEANDL